MPLVAIKGLTNGVRYLFVLAVIDAARNRYDAPSTLCAVPGTPPPPPLPCPSIHPLGVLPA